MIENITQEFLEMIKLPDATCKKLNYLIVMPRQADMRSQYYFPIGLGIVASSLKASGRAVFTLNLTYKENYEQHLKKAIIDNGIDVVATGGLSGQYSLLREVLDIAKSVRPDIITIVGGGIITAEPEVAMEALENVDYGVIGEGEITINALAYALETDANATEVKGVISWGGGGEFIIAPPRPEITNLDCLPFADYDGFDYAEMFDRKYSGLTVVDYFGATMLASRSCPYNCTFCFHPSGEKYRRRTIDNIFKELDWLKSKFPFSRVHFADELFGNDLAYVSEFCKRIKPYGLNYLIQTRLDRVNDEMLDMLKESGCKELCIGVEHINDRILKSMRRKISAAQIEPVLTRMLEKGIRPVSNILFGDLEETAETVREALNWWREHLSFDIHLYYIVTFPGSHIYKAACERGIIKDPVQFLRDGCPMVNITKMTDSEWSFTKDEIAQFRILYEGASSEIDAAQISKTLDSLARKHKVCVWPARHDTITFFKNMSEGFFNSAYFVNINPDAQMLRTSDMKFDRKIYEPDVILKEDIEIVVCPMIRLIGEIRSICESDYPSVRWVLSIPELANLKE